MSELLTQDFRWLGWLMLLWAGSSVASLGFTFAYYQRNPIWQGYRRAEFEADTKFAARIAIFGVFSLLALASRGGFANGFLWPWSTRARREAGIERA